MKDKKLGHCSLALKDLKPEGSEFTLDIKDGGGTLHIFAKLLAAEMPGHVAQRVYEANRLRVHLERVVYQPGEVVRGHVVLNMRKEKHIERLLLNFEGNISMSCSSPGGWTFPCFTVLHTCDILIPAGKLGCGNHVFAFQCVLPEKLPTTSKRMRRGSVDYHFVVIASFDDKEVPDSVYQPIAIVPPLHLMTPTLCMRGNLAALPSEPNGINVKWTRFPNIYLLDHNTPFECSIQHENNGVNLTNFKFQLQKQQVTTFRDGTGAWISDMFDEIMSFIQLPPLSLAYGLTAELKSEFTTQTLHYNPNAFSVPPGIFTSFEVYHYILLTATNDAGKQVICDKKPVFVSHSKFSCEADLDGGVGTDIVRGRFQYIKLTDPNLYLPLLAPNWAVHQRQSTVVIGTPVLAPAKIHTVISQVVSSALFAELPPHQVTTPPTGLHFSHPPRFPLWDRNAPEPLLAEVPLYIGGISAS
jgi:hypothetical protein